MFLPTSDAADMEDAGDVEADSNEDADTVSDADAIDTVSDADARDASEGPPIVSVRPQRVLFNSLEDGQSELVSLMIENRGEGPLLIDSLAIEGDSSGVFSIADGGDALPLEILSARAHSVSLLHESTGDSAPSGTLRMGHNDLEQGGETEVPISIQAPPQRISVTPELFDFGEVEFRTESELSATITNIGGRPLVVEDYFIVGGAGSFTIPVDFEFGSVADGGTITVDPDSSFGFPIHHSGWGDGETRARLIVTSDDPAVRYGDTVVDIRATVIGR